MTPENTLALLLRSASRSEVHAALDVNHRRLLHATVERRRRDGTVRRYGVTVAAFEAEHGVALVVWESEPRNLPAFCPERHIIGHGWFCLGWGPSRPKPPTNDEEAVAWWNVLRGFLRLQDQASDLRRWPEEFAWAHGGAVVFQHRWEIASGGVPKAVLDFSKAIAMQPDGARGEQVRWLKSRCPCGEERAISACHGPKLAELVDLWVQKLAAERAYWSSVCWVECCETMDGCPLSRRALQGGV